MSGRSIASRQPWQTVHSGRERHCLMYVMPAERRNAYPQRPQLDRRSSDLEAEEIVEFLKRLCAQSVTYM